MLFNSFEFALFLPLAFLGYWFVFRKNLKTQNGYLVAISYLFYGWWDWRFLSLIIISSFADYIIGLSLSNPKSQTRKKSLLILSIVINLGFLGVFKYYNFFIQSFVDAFSLFGTQLNIQTLKIVLPVGISFYTFQTLSYSIDVYKGKIKPVKDILSFFAFVSFFPQLVAGPIERATNLIPQFQKARKFDYAKAVDGGRQILWGFFKKMVIADSCAPLVNEIFGNYQDYNGSTLLIGAILFAFQIYGDFSGYSDIAIGTARLFGFNLMRNFAFPYFSRDIAEFWRRWHISLSTWFRDYLYIPLGGSKGGKWMKVRNTFAIFIVSGFWHGANWTFIVWGALNAIYFLPLMLLNKNRNNLDLVAENKLLPNFREFFQITTTFLLVTLSWIFFRSENVAIGLDYTMSLFNGLFSFPEVLPKALIMSILFMVAVEWFQRSREHGLSMAGLKLSPLIRWCCYLIVALFIVGNGQFSETSFIYFAF